VAVAVVAGAEAAEVSRKLRADRSLPAAPA
jgi:hypothetical protein